MSTENIRQDIIDRLAMINKKNKFAIAGEMNEAGWSNLKLNLQQKLDKKKNFLKPAEIIAYICMFITGVLAFIKLAYATVNFDLNKGALLIFITIANTFSYFSRRIQVEKLENQILLLDLLQKINSKQGDETK